LLEILALVDIEEESSSYFRFFAALFGGIVGAMIWYDATSLIEPFGSGSGVSSITMTSEGRPFL
jgi:hypothetical protein